MKPKEHLQATVSDLVADLMYYDRKEDEDLPRGEIERMIEADWNVMPSAAQLRAFIELELPVMRAVSPK